MTNLLINKKFSDKWIYYNEYLQEDYGILLTESEKERRLTKLDRFSGSDPKKAELILNLLIERGEILMPDPNEMDPEN